MSTDRPNRQCERYYLDTGQRCTGIIPGWRHAAKIYCSETCKRAAARQRRDGHPDTVARRIIAADTVRVGNVDDRLEGLTPMQALVAIIVDPDAFDLSAPEVLDRAHQAGVTFGGLLRLARTYSPKGR